MYSGTDLYAYVYKDVFVRLFVCLTVTHELKSCEIAIFRCLEAPQ